MFTILGIGFAQPLILAGLILLPLVWILLRAVPPAPIRRAFPGVALLLGLTDKEVQTDRTPWWLLLLRTLALALAIIAFADPIRNPVDSAQTKTPLLLVLDASWASAPDWPQRQERLSSELRQAQRAGKRVAVVKLTDPPVSGIPFETAAALLPSVDSMVPESWEPGNVATDWSKTIEGDFDTIWFSDGLAREHRRALFSIFDAAGEVTVLEGQREILALTNPSFEDDGVQLDVLRATGPEGARVFINAVGPDPAGVTRILSRSEAIFEAGAKRTNVILEAPAEVRNRFERFEIETERSAGAVLLADDGLRRREVALYSGRENREGLQLLSPSHYLRQALAPSADLIDGALTDTLPANPDVIILADVAVLAEAEAVGLQEWVEAGGLLVRFAGPRLAASDVSRQQEDVLMPVRLRAGGRTIGGAMSWGDPRALREFERSSPFFGLEVPEEVQITAQVLAQPGPELAERTIAALDDGTPLVTRKSLGQGQIVLFHVTANADWSSLPISGLFVSMLERLAISARKGEIDPAEMAGTIWQPARFLDAFGELVDAKGASSVTGEALSEDARGPDLRPGLYDGATRRLALNVLAEGRDIGAANWPITVTAQPILAAKPEPLRGFVLLALLALLALDGVASLWLSGRLTSGRLITPLFALIVLGLGHQPTQLSAQDADEFALSSTSKTVLAYVLTGDQQVDTISHAGLTGLSDALFRRTSVEPADPIGVDLEIDELSFFPILYWPVTQQQEVPSPQAYARLNRYLRGGGLVLFDTRDAGNSGFGRNAANETKLQTLALPLDIPPLEPVPSDHILTRTFYLLQEFPGRHLSRDVWVEAAPVGQVQAEGMPFRNLNDNVTPVLIGGNDWASAWAVDANGNWMFPVGRGLSGERQREYAIRFGVNLVMHVLTGNYKSDQVHVPALLERLGQ